MSRLSTRLTLASLACAGLVAASAAAGDLYIAGNAGVIWHFDTATGTVDHPISCGGTVQGMAVQGRHIYAAASTNSVYKLNLDTGAFEDVWGTDGAPLSLSRWGNTLYLTTQNGDMQWRNAGDFSLIETYYTHDPLQATVLFGNQIFTGSWSTAVYTSPIGDLDFNFFTACGGSVNSMATDGEDLIIGTREGTVYIYDAVTGGYKATWGVASDCVGIAYIDGRIFTAAANGKVHRMNPANGAIEQVYNTGLTITAMTIGESCAADFNGDGVISTLDFLSFLNAWNADDSRADMDHNGVLNTQDVLVFLNAYTAGCSL